MGGIQEDTAIPFLDPATYFGSLEYYSGQLCKERLGVDEIHGACLNCAESGGAQWSARRIVMVNNQLDGGYEPTGHNDQK